MNKILLYCHETNLTKAYLATVVISYKTTNQLFNQCYNNNISLSREEGARYGG